MAAVTLSLRSATTTWKVISLPSRMALTFIFWPTCRAAIVRSKSCVSLMGFPLISIMISPILIPALSAGSPLKTSDTNAPFLFLWFKFWAISSVISCTDIPSQPRVTFPFVFKSARMLLAILIGMAKPIPWPCATMAVLMPMTFPSILNSGPPLLPGLIEASV